MKCWRIYLEFDAIQYRSSQLIRVASNWNNDLNETSPHGTRTMHKLYIVADPNVHIQPRNIASSKLWWPNLHWSWQQEQLNDLLESIFTNDNFERIKFMASDFVSVYRVQWKFHALFLRCKGISNNTIYRQIPDII